MALQYLIGDACVAGSLDLSQPGAGGARDFTRPRRHIIDGQRRTVGDDRFQADHVVMQGRAERRFEGIGVTGGADAAARGDALGHRFHAHDFTRRRIGNHAQFLDRAQLFRAVTRINQQHFKTGGAHETLVDLARAQFQAARNIILGRGEFRQIQNRCAPAADRERHRLVPMAGAGRRRRERLAERILELSEGEIIGHDAVAMVIDERNIRANFATHNDCPILSSDL